VIGAKSKTQRKNPERFEKKVMTSRIGSAREGTKMLPFPLCAGEKTSFKTLNPTVESKEINAKQFNGDQT